LVFSSLSTMYLDVFSMIFVLLGVFMSNRWNCKNCIEQMQIY
jgi:hypothetical protein